MLIIFTVKFLIYLETNMFYQSQRLVLLSNLAIRVHGMKFTASEGRCIKISHSYNASIFPLNEYQLRSSGHLASNKQWIHENPPQYQYKLPEWSWHISASERRFSVARDGFPSRQTGFRPDRRLSVPTDGFSSRRTVFRISNLISVLWYGYLSLEWLSVPLSIITTCTNQMVLHTGREGNGYTHT